MAILCWAAKNSLRGTGPLVNSLLKSKSKFTYLDGGNPLPRPAWWQVVSDLGKILTNHPTCILSPVAPFHRSSYSYIVC